MGPADISIDLVQGPRLAYAGLVCAPRGDAPAHRSHLLAPRPVEALAKAVVICTPRGEDLRAGRQGPGHHAVPHRAPGAAGAWS